MGYMSHDELRVEVKRCGIISQDVIPKSSYRQLLQSCTRYRYKRDKEDINQLASVLRYREVDSQWGKASQLVINWQVERPC